MKIQTLFLFTAIIGLVFGLGYLLMPGMMFSFFGITDDVNNMLIGRFFGAGIFCQFILAWYSRNLEKSSARNVIVLFFFLNFSFGTVLTLIGVFSGLLSAAGWIGAGMFIILAVAFGYNRFVKSGAE